MDILFLDYSESDEGFDFMRLIIRGSDAQRLKALVEASLPFLDLEETENWISLRSASKTKLNWNSCVLTNALTFLSSAGSSWLLFLSQCYQTQKTNWLTITSCKLGVWNW